MAREMSTENDIRRSESQQIVKREPSWSQDQATLSRSTSSEQIIDVTQAAKDKPSVIPPPNFGAVLDGKIYRSAFPSAENLGHLETLGLRTVLTLVDGPYPEEYTEWIHSNFVTHHNITLMANKERVKIDVIDMAKIMDIVMDPENYPLLIHCNKGKHRTGCVVGTYRKCNSYPMDKILAEYRHYASTKARLLDQVYLQGVDTDNLLRVREDYRHDSLTEDEGPWVTPALYAPVMPVALPLKATF